MSQRLTPTARVILGMIALGKRTGYEIKNLVDKSTRNFWAASYGQIYPELRRLEERGLIRGRPEPTGERARTVHELTDEGWSMLRGWLEDEAEPGFEVRDEGMLKLFFSDFAAPGMRIAHLGAMRAYHERVLAQLRTLAENGGPVNQGPRLTLELGMGLHQWLADWCAATERRLREQE